MERATFFEVGLLRQATGVVNGSVAQSEPMMGFSPVPM